MIYELLPNKEVLYVVPVTSIPGKLPVVGAGDTGTIPHKYHTATRSGAHRFNAQIARADSRPGAGDGCAIGGSGELLSAPYFRRNFGTFHRLHQF